jgi:hypothetical protein
MLLDQRPAQPETNVAPSTQQDRPADGRAEIDERVDAHARLQPSPITPPEPLGGLGASKARRR